MLKACCPFHQDATPSFIVYPNTKDFHCFGCGVNGTVVDYIMHRLHTTSASEALYYISNQYGIKLDGFNEVEYKKKKALIGKKRTEAASYFKNFTKANDFMKQRKISLDTFKKYGIGWDVERQAVAIPYLNTYGEVVGMSFRLFNEDGPKYINESETDIFHKSHLLYGLDKARKDTKKHVYIVEGYFDVLALHDMGLPGVAYCGSSLTEEQITLLSHYITNETKIYLIPDNDKTGMKAVHKNIEKLSKLKNKLAVIEMPEGIKDPNDLLIAGQAVQEIKPTHVLMFQLKTALNDCLDKEDEYEAAFDIAQKTKNEMLKQEMVRYLSERWKESLELVSKHMESGVPEESLLDHIHGFQETFIEYQSESKDGDKSFITTGYEKLDERIPKHFRKKELIYVMGRSGSGKTTFAVNLAYNAVHHQNKNVAFFSIELPRTAVMPQFIQIHKNWPEKMAERFAQDKENYDDELRYLMNKFNEHMAFVDKEGSTLEDIEKYVHLMNEQYFKKPVDVIFIDYFGMIKRPGKKEAYHEYSEQARSLKEMAKRLDCTVVCLSQANRDGGKDGSTPLTLQSSRDTGAIEESGDYVLGIYRPGLNPSLDDNERVVVEKEIRIQVLKARWGLVGECLLQFDGKTKKITDWPDNLPKLGSDRDVKNHKRNGK